MPAVAEAAGAAVAVVAVAAVGAAPGAAVVAAAAVAAAAVAAAAGSGEFAESARLQHFERQQGRTAVRAEFHRLCAATQCRLPLFREPEVLSSRRALLCAGLGNRGGRKQLSG